MSTNENGGISFPDLPDTKAVRNTSVPSIRQIILMGLAEGRNTPSIEAVIKQYHPTSMAASKAAIHIGWYKGDCKKKAKMAGVKVTPELYLNIAAGKKLR